MFLTDSSAFIHSLKYKIFGFQLNYGLFLDTYTANMLLDNFIENKQYQGKLRKKINQMSRVGDACYIQTLKGPIPSLKKLR